MASEEADRVIRDRIARAKAIAGYSPKFNRDDIDVDSLADLTARMAHDAKVIDALVGEALATAATPLPAQTPTEDQIVAALKADPAMAGRVIVALADGMPGVSRERCQSAAYAASEHPQRHRSLQSLAVALAAASYRG